MKEIKILNTQKNMTPVLQEILKTLTDDTMLVFEDTEYHFYKDGTYVDYFAPSNNYASVKNVVFTIFDKKNITIQGNGAKFIFHGRIFPFILQGCDNLTMSDFSIDFAFPRVYQAEVLESNEKYLEFYMDKQKYPYSVRNGHLILHLEEMDRDVEKANYFNRDANIELSKKWPEKWNMTHLCVEGEESRDWYGKIAYSQPRENVLRLTYLENSLRYPYEKANRLILKFEPHRDYDTIFLDGCNNVVIQGVSIYRGSSMGIISQLCENMTFDRLYIGAKAERGDLVSTTADAIMFVDCSGKIVLKNSYVAQSFDDGFNLHGTYTGFAKVDEHTILAELIHHEQKGFNPYRVGDVLQIIDHKTLEIKGTLTVEKSTLCKDEKHILIGVKETVADNMNEGDFIENYTRMPELEIINNEFYQVPAIQFSTPKKVLVKGNKFHTLLEAIRVKDAPMGFMESGRVEDVLITENTFEHCCEWADGHVIDVIERLEREQPKDDIHKNIRIKNNRFVGSNTDFIIVRCSKDVEISGNAFVFEGARRKENALPFTLEYSSNIKIHDNDLKL